jgi:hypothetical protein
MNNVVEIEIEIEIAIEIGIAIDSLFLNTDQLELPLKGATA